MRPAVAVGVALLLEVVARIAAWIAPPP